MYEQPDTVPNLFVREALTLAISWKIKTTVTYLVCMLLWNHIRFSFTVKNFGRCDLSIYRLVTLIRAAYFGSFGFVFKFGGRALYTLRPHITHPTGNFPTSGTSRITTTQQMLSKKKYLNRPFRTERHQKLCKQFQQQFHKALFKAT